MQFFLMIHLSLSKIVESENDLVELGINADMLACIFECLFNGLNDYTTDSKGDSGSKYVFKHRASSLRIEKNWLVLYPFLRVRETCIEGLEVYTKFCGRYAPAVLDEQL